MKNVLGYEMQIHMIQSCSLKVDFFWINRDQVSFEWFIYLLNELEQEQAEKGGEMERFLDLHLYMTAMKDYASLEAFGLQMALDSVYKKVRTKIHRFTPHGYKKISEILF